MKKTQASMDGTGLKIAIVLGRFNDLIGNALLRGAQACLSRHGVKEDDIQVITVPGAFEMPLALQALAKAKKHDALIALGAVIRGATPHFDYVAGEAAKGIAATSLAFSIPIGFGLLTCNSLEQAMDRAGGKCGNKGEDAARTAIEMATLLRTVQRL